jgi:hypothetical protein
VLFKHRLSLLRILIRRRRLGRSRAIGEPLSNLISFMRLRGGAKINRAGRRLRR